MQTAEMTQTPATAAALSQEIELLESRREELLVDSEASADELAAARESLVQGKKNAIPSVTGAQSKATAIDEALRDIDRRIADLRRELVEVQAVEARAAAISELATIAQGADETLANYIATRRECSAALRELGARLLSARYEHEARRDRFIALAQESGLAPLIEYGGYVREDKQTPALIEELEKAGISLTAVRTSLSPQSASTPFNLPTPAMEDLPGSSLIPSLLNIAGRIQTRAAIQNQ
jgi:hypothetical protein